MDIKHALFSFNGRIRRRDWWMWSVGMVLIQTLAMRLIDTLLFGPDPDLQAANYFTWFFGAPATGVQWSALAVGLVFLWPALALTLKRAHDRDRRGWDVGAIQIASAASALLPADAFETAGRAFDLADYAAAAPLAVFAVALLVASLYQLVVLGFLDGTLGPNRFGRSPKGIGGEPADRAAEVFS